MTISRNQMAQQIKKSGRKKPPGLYANINAKRKRIAAGSGEKMRKKGAPGAPARDAFAKIKQSENRKKRRA